ncbi:MAG: TIGR04168 family protein [Cyanobacteria bacterium P01_G01_bin.38]
MEGSLGAIMGERQAITIAAIGDIHGQWEAEDAIALQHLEVDLALFVGDFGNEAVDVVQKIAAVPLPKAVILGNHDAWYSASEKARKRCPYDRAKEDRVTDQLGLLGESHVGFGKLEMPESGVTVVGARPYSWGGPHWRNAQFYLDRCDVSGFEASTQRIMKAVEAAEQDTIIFLGHSGPMGLGDRPHDPCGKDWRPAGGDYGDPDFAAAIAQTRAFGKQIPLVVFGHMHHQIKTDPSRLRTRVVVDAHGTVHLNAANVPRVQTTELGRLRSFSLIRLWAGRVQDIRLVWVNQSYQSVAEEILYRQYPPAQQSLNPN